MGLGRRAGGRRLTEGRLQPKAEVLDIDRHHDIAIGDDRVLDRGQRVAPLAQQFRGNQRLFGAERGAGKRHRAVARGGRGAIDRFERKRHLRPRPMGSCHRVLLS